MKSYTGNCFDFYKKVVESKNKTKNDPNYKNRLVALEPRMDPVFKGYKEFFDLNTLFQLGPSCFKGQSKKDLLKLYRYKASLFQKLNNDLIKLENGRTNNICPFCTINTVNTLDHIVPKKKFPEFSANPINLIPCCSECNSYKKDSWDPAEMLLNPYLDHLPDEQYLYTNINVENNIPVVEFYLDNSKGNISETLFNKLEKSYETMHLLRRFKESSHNVISELEDAFKSAQGGGLAKAVFLEIAENQAKQRQERYSFNYWRAILELGMINSGFL